MRVRCLIFISFLIWIGLPFPFSFEAKALSVREEEKYGRILNFEILKGSKLYSDPLLLLYIDSIRKRLEKEASIPFQIKIIVIDSKKIDAFATIGGFIYLTTGLISRCESEDELAGVIAHELAHIAKRHVTKRIEKQKKLDLALLAAMFAAMLAPDSQGKDAILAGATATYETMVLKYSREDEEEADIFGSYLLEKAGFSPSGIKEFLKRLRIEGGIELPEYLLTHPYPEERIKKLEGKPTLSKENLIFSFQKARVMINMSFENEQKKLRSDDPLNLYRETLFQIRKGKVDEALNLLERLKPLIPKIFSAELLIKVGKYKEAIEILDKEENEISYFLKALSFESLKKESEAFSLLERILSLGDSCPEIYRRYGLLAGKFGREAEGYEYLGKFELSLGRREMAKRYIEKALFFYGPKSEKAKELSKLLEEIE